MPLGASVTLKYLSPVFTAIFAVLFLKEKVRPIQYLFFIGAFVGVLLLKGFDTRIDNLNLVLGIAGAFFAGLVYVLIRKIGKNDHPIVIINYFMFSATIISAVLMFTNWRTPNLRELIILISIGLFGFFAQVFMTNAFQLEKASKVSQVKYMEVVYALLIGLFWFGESYSLLSFMGILLIILSMFLNVITKEKIVSQELNE